MNDKELQATREVYKKFDEQRKKTGESRKRLYELEQNPLIQEYLELKKFMEEVRMEKYSEDNISEHIFSEIISNTENSHGIYVHIGREVDCDSHEVNWGYKDLETGNEIWISESQQIHKFERSNKVIYIFPKTEIHSNEIWFKWYNKIRGLFLSYVIKQPQEQAVKKLMHKYSKNYR